MNTYSELKARLKEIGWRDISRNYSGPSTYMLHLGFGQQNNPWPRQQLIVVRHQCRDGHGRIWFEDWLITQNGSQGDYVRDLEQVYAVGRQIAEREMEQREVVA